MLRMRAILALCVMVTACGNDAGQAPETVQLRPYGPPLGVNAPVVRSVRATTGGAITGTFTGAKGDEITGLRGLCNPDTFANFMLSLPGGKDVDEVWVTNLSKHAVGTGATGEFPLDYVEVAFRKMSADSFVQREFRGPGTLTTHDATSGHRRMVGSMEGRGLEGKDAEAARRWI